MRGIFGNRCPFSRVQNERSRVKILIIEDDRILAEYLRLALKEDGHAADVAATGEEGLRLAMIHDFDTILLDYVLPGLSGVQVVSELRHRQKTTPVLMLTGRDSKSSIVEGLDAGADDYLTKPFEIAELRARLRAMARRDRGGKMDNTRLGDLVLNRMTRRIEAGSRPLNLTPREYLLLEYLLLRPRQVVSRTELLEKVWELQFDPGSNVVDVHVARLRNKLRDARSGAVIVTVRGAGFMLDLAEPAPEVH